MPIFLFSLIYCGDLTNMRDRKMQRILRKMGCKEEKLDLRDHCGIRDPTPYEAVKRIVADERRSFRRANQEEQVYGTAENTDNSV